MSSKKKAMIERAPVINQLLDERGYGFRIDYEEVVANNCRKDSYQFYGSGYNVMPVLYYDDSWWNMTDSALAEYLYDIFIEKSYHLDEKPFFNRAFVISHVLPKIVSKQNATAFLEEKIICVPVLDMILTFYLPLQDSEDGLLSIKITEEFLQMVSIDELKNAALENIENHYRIEKLEHMLAEMGEDTTLPDTTYPMYVITNDSRIYGAAAILSREVMLDLSREMGTEDIILLPVSIHEFAAISLSEEIEFSFLIKLVKNANDNIINLEDKLTDSIYIWRAGKFTVLH